MDDKTKQTLDAYCTYLEECVKNIRLEIEKDHVICCGDQVADNVAAGCNVLWRIQTVVEAETEARERRN